MKNRKQLIKYRNQNINLEVLRCLVHQGSILEPLLLKFGNDFMKSTKLLVPIMFADKSNLFYTNKNIKVLNQSFKKLHHVNEWFIANKI